MGRKLIVGLVIIIVALAVFFATKYYYTVGEVTAEEQSQVLMEKIKTVAKLVTVEGYFSEIYDYKDYWNYDISPFRKKALIRVKAKVSVGYDLTKMSIEAIPEQKLLIISDLPDPSIISIDHDLDYYDITEGTFNSFSEKDYTMMNRNAKDKIRQTAISSDLFLAAEEQSNKMLDLVKFMVEGAGWQLQFKPRGGFLKIDTLQR
jgi:Protein of unknown function (DUF4230)